MQESVFSMPVVVGESSIDLLGHVNNREYMCWMEAAATAHAASLGWSFDALRSAGRVWVVRQHWIEYLRSARLGDELVVATWGERVRAHLERQAPVVPEALCSASQRRTSDRRRH